MTVRTQLIAVACLAMTASCGFVRDRGMDFADCFKLSVGTGFGLAVDVKLTGYISPGVGFASYTLNAGWDDRRVFGLWRESDVINTPRIAYEVLLGDFRNAPVQYLDRNVLFLDLAFSSLNLPNERWIRSGHDVTVEYYSLFNFGEVSEQQRAFAMTGGLVDPDQRAREVEKTVWQRGFLDVGVTAGPVHARVGFNPLQLVDFLLGWFGVDIASDDGVRRRPVRLRDRGDALDR